MARSRGARRGVREGLPIAPVPGFRAAGVRSGIKTRGLDLALIVSDVEAAAAGVFTRSSFVGAPVEWSRRIAAGGRARAIVVNSGCSNVSMGERGRRDARQMAEWAGREAGCGPERVFVASTGVIGQPLPMERVQQGIPAAARALAADGLAAAAEAIRTTDTFAKAAWTRLQIGGRPVTVAGIAKGSGMIEPDMATMLSFILTDAAAAPRFLRGVLKRVADRTFNRVTVDGETSTSDSVVLLANGLAGGRSIAGPSHPDAAAFESAVLGVAEALARQLARDGEGATKLVTVDVKGARNAAEAERTARRIANSLLVKTALFGRDPNWGRIMQTIGAGRVALAPERTVVKLGGVVVFRGGRSAGQAARERARERLERDEIPIEVDLGVGTGEARIWTCDLSYDYVRINAEYTT